jgi:hypothetical protein
MSKSKAFAAVDQLTLGTVNSALTTIVAATELAGWLSEERFDVDGRAILAVETFFLEVPLETQVAFLANHRIPETHAVSVARGLGLREDIPLALKQRW